MPGGENWAPGTVHSEMFLEWRTGVFKLFKLWHLKESEINNDNYFIQHKSLNLSSFTSCFGGWISLWHCHRNRKEDTFL